MSRLLKIVLFVVCILAMLSLSSAWTVPFSLSPSLSRRISNPTFLKMALDYNDPVVSEEFTKVQQLEFEEVEKALLEYGIPIPASVNDIDARLMLVETRLRMTGRLSDGKPKEKKTSYSSEYERLMHENPLFEELIREMKVRGDQNAVNVAVEYVNNPTLANRRYGETYANLIRQVKKAISTAPPVKSKIIRFSGFPANMGEAGCKMTLEALGPLVSFECAESEDFPILAGKVEFEDVETAQKAVDTYNGMQMGMGTTLELASV